MLLGISFYKIKQYFESAKNNYCLQQKNVLIEIILRPTN